MGTKRSDTMTLGFALFAMFFGAGNLIFPPFLGFTSGGSWTVGFLCFIAADAGLSLLALFTIAAIGDGVEGITGSYTFDEYNNPIKSAAMIQLQSGEENFIEMY